MILKLSLDLLHWDSAIFVDVHSIKEEVVLVLLELGHDAFHEQSKLLLLELWFFIETQTIPQLLQMYVLRVDLKSNIAHDFLELIL